jgi:hypothetical protein
MDGLPSVYAVFLVVNWPTELQNKQKLFAVIFSYGHFPATRPMQRNVGCIMQQVLKGREMHFFISAFLSAQATHVGVERRIIALRDSSCGI